jgi:hypothetical protein
MTAILQDPIFRDEAKAREWLEARVWPSAIAPESKWPRLLTLRLRRGLVKPAGRCPSPATIPQLGAIDGLIAGGAS